MNVKRIKSTELGKDFPEFTICPDLISGYNTKLLKNYNVTKAQFIDNGIKNLNWNLYDKVALPLNKVVEKIMFRTGENNYKYQEILSNKTIQFRNMMKLTIEERYGKCATLKIPEVRLF